MLPKNTATKVIAKVTMENFKDFIENILIYQPSECIEKEKVFKMEYYQSIIA
jgi:hypothetical protein